MTDKELATRLTQVAQELIAEAKSLKIPASAIHSWEMLDPFTREDFVRVLDVLVVVAIVNKKGPWSVEAITAMARNLATVLVLREIDAREGDSEA